jgi:PAS domain S-box-containing protein
MRAIWTGSTLVRWSVCSAAAIVFVLGLAFAASAFAALAEQPAAKRLLIISTGSRLAPGFVRVDQQILEALGRRPAPHVDIYTENLDLVRFPAEQFQRIFTEYLAEKYADSKPDVVILVFVGNVGIPGKVLAGVFPNTPIIVAGLTEEELQHDQFGGLVGGFAQRTNPAATLALIRRLQPDLRRLVIVSGTAEVDRELLQRTLSAAQPLRTQIDIEVWDHLTIGELRQAVTKLPSQTAVLYARMFRDAAGQAVISSEVGQWIGRTANAPVYVLTDASFGTGAVGGSIASIEAFGRRTGELARGVLWGQRSRSVPFEVRTDTVRMFDWRALKRWGIEERRLPEGSIIRFRPQSIWDLYRWYIVGALGIFLLQSVMIVALIVQRRRLHDAQENVKSERAFLRKVIDVTPTFIFAKDREGRFSLANKAVADAYGVSVDALIGRTDADFNRHADEVSHFQKIDLEVIESGEERFIPEERITDAQGNVHWLQTVKRPLKGTNGKPDQVLGASTDITERRQAEIEVQEQRAVLAHVGRVSIMGELAASLAHELNQPLTAILTNAKAGLRFLGREPVDLNEVRDALNDIVEANDHAAEIIRSTRALVKKEEQPQFRPIDLGELVGDVVALIHSDATLHQVRILLDVDRTAPLVRGDRVQLQQVVLNILMNAFDAMAARPPSARRVEVRLERSGNAINRIAICDNGAGFEENELGRIFQPFYTTKREGLGMGLSICRSIIEAHDGRLWAENNPGGGATFYFTVPVYQEK